MINRNRITTPLLGGSVWLASVFLSAPTALASSHREAPLVASDPDVDSTDVYAWVQKGSHNLLTIAVNYLPLEEPAGGPNFHKFSDDVLYEINISKGDDLRPSLSYRFEFKTAPIVRADPANLNAGLLNGKEFFAQLAG